MVGIFLSAVYAIFAHLALGLSFGRIYLNATNFLFYWFAACGIASTLLLILVIAGAAFGLSLYSFQIRSGSTLARYGLTLSATAIISNIFKYAFLLTGTWLLHNSYYEGSFHKVELAIGILLVYIGVVFKSSLSRKKRYTRIS